MRRPCFQRQHEVGTARDDVRRDGRLSPHRIDRDDRPFDIDLLQQLRNGRAPLSWKRALDFSSVATCPSVNPKSAAHRLTEVHAPQPLAQSWLRRSVWPSIAKTG